MPSTSEKQRRLMEAAAASPKVAKKVGVPMKVAKEFRAADRKQLRGGSNFNLKKEKRR